MSLQHEDIDLLNALISAAPEASSATHGAESVDAHFPVRFIIIMSGRFPITNLAFFARDVG
jgi:hypothetical protein